ncbi:regulatory protein, gntR family [Micromonospora pattaloongensis]|uniref:Regulatory protein, gntR family n=1 Tax=Micromonospora pattaloongensis TaxID=405436 RepID=A0A1H3Q221_9ACTN|nr:winged helix-turn-helix domain-containing protein [Micromonospora pattaloongensis]SDZ07283.1 regulatory protein, gntR family [Micromonospora pattaloongensis]
MPKQQYQVLADALRAKIESGEWAPGTKLPSRSQLCKDYGVSDTVVGKAMMILRATGLTETLEGVGVFVADRS